MPVTPPLPLALIQASLPPIPVLKTATSVGFSAKRKDLTLDPQAISNLS
jgi:hypothetical protein